jgi:hypothetical protein
MKEIEIWLASSDIGGSIGKKLFKLRMINRGNKQYPGREVR